MEQHTSFQIEEVTFTSSGVDCAARLYRPDTTSTAVPCVVLAAGMNQTRVDGFPRFAERFARSGYAALIFDYRYLGESAGEPRQLVDYEQQRDDLRAAVEFVRSLEGIDPVQVILWGFSMGGGHVVTVAAEDKQIAAAIVLCPFLDGLKFSSASNVSNTLRQLAAAARASWIREPIRMPLTAPPGQLALFNQPEARQGFPAVAAEDSLWLNELLINPTQPPLRVRPIRQAKQVACPMWIGLATRDTMVPTSSIRQLAQRAPLAELRTFSGGHFGGFLEHFDEVVKSQLAFLRRALAHS